jgi:tRNA dimethylallyltransferase
MSTKLKPQVIFLMGPTTSGKTALAIKISEKINTRIISVDSSLIYKKMNIGTAKPDAKTLAKYPHYLIDICQPDKVYSAHNFVKDANKQIEIAFNNNQLPILVGGTSFYFNAIEHGLSDLPNSTDKSKQKFNKMLAQQGLQSLYQQLQKIDKPASIKIHANDKQRIIRALEVFYLSGKTLTELQGKKIIKNNYAIKKIIINPPKQQLHKNIEKRFLTMLEQDFLAEVKYLKEDLKLAKTCNSMRSVGYAQAFEYLEGLIDKPTMIEKAIIATRQLAKRQNTWLKKEKQALQLEKIDLKKALEFIEN